MADRQDFWNFAAGAIFIALFVLCVFSLEYTGGLFRLFLLRPFDVIVLSFATFRLAHLLTDDKIFNFVRDFFHDEGKNAAARPERIASRIVYEILECIWCTGIWSALIVVTVYFSALWGVFAVYVFAIAGAGSLLKVACGALASVFENEKS